MFKYLIIFLIIICVNIGLSQNNYQDVIYLKNGSIIKGIIIEQIPNKSFKIETADSNVFVFSYDEIEKITKEKIIEYKNEPDLIENSKIGYLGILETSYGAGLGELSSLNNRVRVNVINGFKSNPYFYIGLGTGLTYYVNEGLKLNEVTIPMFLDFRYFTSPNKQISPYFVLNTGYNFATDPGLGSGGILLNTGFGLSINLNNNNNLNISFLYDIQRESSNEIYWNTSDVYYRQSLNINLGLTF